MSNIRSKELSLGLLLVVTGCASQSPIVPSQPEVVAPQKLNKHSLIAPALLKADVDYLVAKIREIHPQPWSHLSSSQFEDQVNGLLSGLRYPMTRREFYLQVAPLVAAMLDSHTFVEFPRDDLSDYFFPLAVTIEAEGDADNRRSRIYVAADLSGVKLIPAGAEILSIDKAPVSYLLNRMSTLVAAETPAGQRRNVQLNFARYLSLLGFDSPQHSISYLWNGAREQKTISAMKLTMGEPDNTSFYGFSKLTNQTGLLWLNDFNEDPDKFAQFLDTTFGRLERDQLQNLIVDLRFNQGGLTQNMMSLLSYLTDRDLAWAKRGQMKVSGPLKREYFNSTEKLRKDHLVWGLKWLPLEWTDKMQRDLFWADSGQLVDMPLSVIAPSNAHNLRYLGVNVWFVTNGYCYSACAFASAIGKHYQLTKVLGESVGSRVTEQYAYPVKSILPHSGLTVRVASTVINTELESKDSTPDVTINRTQADIQNKNDRPLNQALREAELGL